MEVQSSQLEDFGSFSSWERTHYSPFYQWYQLANGTADRRRGLDASQDLTKFLIEGIGILAVATLGTVGNLLSAWILSRPKMRSSINCLLLGLALTDTLFIWQGICAMALPRVFFYNKVNLFRYRFTTWIPSIYAVGITTHTASVLFTLAVTLERYMAVKHPIQARVFCTLSRARLTTSAIVIFSVLYNVPRWFEYGYCVLVNKESLEKEYFLVTMPMRKDPIYVKWIFSVHFILLYMIPMTLIVVFNCLIYRGIKMARKERESLSASQLNENSLAVMLLAVVLVFLACNVLPIVNLVARIITGFPEIYVVDTVRNFLWVFNSSVNFVVYYAYSERFREMFVGIWPVRLRMACCPAAEKRRRQLKYSMRSTIVKSMKTTRISISIINTTPTTQSSSASRDSLPRLYNISEM